MYIYKRRYVKRKRQVDEDGTIRIIEEVIYYYYICENRRIGPTKSSHRFILEYIGTQDKFEARFLELYTQQQLITESKALPGDTPNPDSRVPI